MTDLAAVLSGERRWCVITADCRDVLGEIPNGTVDAVVTDPPYGHGAYETDRAVGVDVYRRLIDAGTCCACFGYPEAMVALCIKLSLVPSEWVTWFPPNKPNGRGGVLCKMQEVIAFWGKIQRDATVLQSRTAKGKEVRAYVQGIRPIKNSQDLNYCKASDVMQDSAPGTMFNAHLRQHPNEKPVTLMRKVCQIASADAALILDPFCGSGTTGVAGLQLGRRFIGIEIDPHYADIARTRCDAAERQGRLSL